MELNLKPYKHYNLDLEREIIGCMILDNGTIHAVTQMLSKENFYLELNQQIFETIKQMFDHGVTCSLNLVTQHVCKKNYNHGLNSIPYEITLCTRDVVNTAEYYVKQLCLHLVELYVARETHGMSIAHLKDGDSLEKLHQRTEALNNAVKINTGDEWLSIQDAMVELINHRQEVADGKIKTIPSGFRELDEVLGGGFAPGFGLIYARPGGGKSAFAASLIMNMTCKVGLINLEMPINQVASRLISIDSGVPFQKIFMPNEQYRNSRNYAENENVIHNSIENLSRRGIMISKDLSLNIPRLRYSIINAVKKHKAEIIFIDYIQLVELDDEFGKKRYEMVGKLSRGLKLLSKELNVPIIALAQVNRESEKSGTDANKMPKLSQLRESGNLEQDIDLGICIDRPHARNVLNSLETDGIIDVQKHRNGKTKTMEIQWDGNRMYFHDKNIYKQMEAHNAPIYDNPRAGMSSKHLTNGDDTPF